MKINRRYSMKKRLRILECNLFCEMIMKNVIEYFININV